ncbi:hypothetical protein OG321_43350 [Streptomyces sp. NBC_00424]|uniref:hypothetical protein n=2 Tax=unclassified Streptomyces TaxID=2593676 RepID=UPI00225553EE|nr:hypothetical protein [Streptomyces sp. NBC_00424]MCX5079216.1 hypothetical protein [Streptomyces sp. NBC_00424]
MSPVASNAQTVRRQRVRVPMRLVSSPFYADVALSVYVKVKALAARPEGCTARSSTIASYLGLSVSSVERGMTQLSRRGPDGVVELWSKRRTLSGGKGESALRSVRPMTRTEGFVWLPVAASEDLTPRQLRAYAVIAFAEQTGIALTEGELAGYLRHHSGRKVGRPISAAAAGEVIDGLEAARWVTVQRRAGAQGRHRFIAHDIAPTAPLPRCEPVADSEPETVQECPQEPGGGAVEGADSSLVGEGSGLSFDKGSLANKESPRTDSPDDERALISPAVGEVQVVEAAEAVENQAAPEARSEGEGGVALRAGEISQPSSKPNGEKRSSKGRGPARSSYTGPRLTMSPEIYAVLEPVHVLLEQVTSAFVARKIVREVGRQLREGTAADRLRHRLTARLATVALADIRDPGQWLLGVALPRWGCGHQDCEAGIIWRTGTACELCAETVQDRFAARRREQRLEQGLCPQHGTRPGPSGHCADCGLEAAIRLPARVPAPRDPEGPQRATCGGCGCVIFLTGRAVDTGRCKLCREEADAGAAVEPAASAAPSVPGTCSGRDGETPCTRRALPTRSVCLTHRSREFAGEVA